MGVLRPFDFPQVWTIDFRISDAVALYAWWRESCIPRANWKYWRDDLLRMREAPFPADGRTVVITFAAWAEMECFQILGWPQPKHVIDLYAEHRVQTNGVLRPSKDRRDNLLTAARIRGLDPMDTQEKRAMVELILSKDDFTPEEIERILHYCTEDVRITEQLLLKMLPRLDVSRALWRGQYGWPVAATQRNAVPLDVPLQQRFVTHWDSIKRIAIRELDHFGIFRDTSFNAANFWRRSGYARASRGRAHPALVGRS